MKLIERFMRVFFDLLYHPFVFAYDLVAAMVSFGQWKDWTKAVLPFISGTRILELGHGPGHLQRILLDRNLAPFAIDESAQMGALAKRRLGSFHKLTRGLGQHLPFVSGSFDCIVSTFPTEYIFHKQTLSEIRRCLSDGGRLIVLPVAWPKSRVLKWMYRVTGEIPTDRQTSIQSRMKAVFINAGFATEVIIVEVKSDRLLIIAANK